MAPQNVDERRRIGARIKELRLELNITQDEMANTVGIARSSLARIEAGKHGASLDILSGIAKALGKTIDFC